MKLKIRIEKKGDHGLVNLSRFCRFDTTKGGRYAAITSDLLFSVSAR